MIFRQMTKADIEAVAALERVCFSEPWDEKACLYELEQNPFSNGWLVVQEDEIVAYAFLWETFEMAQIARIGVDLEQRKKGIGKFLLENLCQRAKDACCEYMTLEVRVSNEAALGLYQGFDFIQVNCTKNYYPDGEDALVLTKAL